jgi:hypothetical protein
MPHRAACGQTLNSRRFRSLCDAFAAEYGGQLTEVDRSLIAQAAGLTLRAEHLQAAIVRGEDVSNDELVRISSTAKRLLEAIRAKAKNKPSVSLREFIASKYGSTPAEATEDDA